MTARLARPLRVLAAAVIVGAGLVGSTPPAPVRAAGPDLTIRSDVRYDVLPADHRIHVTALLTATNHLSDTPTRQFYFDRAYLQVQPAISGLAISGASQPSVRVSAKRASSTLLLITFGSRLQAGASMTFTLQFDLRDVGTDPNRDVRVGASLVTFPMWDYATPSTPGGSVSAFFPAGFSVSIEPDAGLLKGPTATADGRLSYVSGTLATPLSFYAYATAERPGAYTETTRVVDLASGEAALAIDAWPDDPAWGSRVGDLFGRGLPVLGAAIGLPWQQPGTLRIREALARSTGGYAGQFDPAAGQIDVAYYAGSGVILHEAAHAWFNGRLVADRWAAEGFASYYAALAAASLKMTAASPALTKALAPAAIPLNSWTAPAGATRATEDYGYAASFELAKQIAARAGADGLRAVWSAAATEIGAYQPGGTAPAETVDGAPDWRGLLDLLEERTGATYVDLWRKWVARPADLPLLDARAAARSLYVATVRRAGDWMLPRSIRDAMRAWQFDLATTELGEAGAVLDQRAILTARAAAAGLRLPPTLQLAFEGSDGLGSAGQVATAELAAIDVIDRARSTRPVAPDPVVLIGLIGAQPDASLATARAAFAAGDLRAAVAAASDAQTGWSTAADVGRGRLLSGLALLLALGLAVVLVLTRSRRSRRLPHARKT